MMTAATRQDLQGVVEYARNSIMNGMASRSYMQQLADQLRSSILSNLHEMHAENQGVIKSGQSDRAQIIQRVASIEQEVRMVRQMMSKIADQQVRLTTMMNR